MIGPAADAFDYVIVGGGAAGSVLAARLSEDPHVTAALIEWGPTDLHEPRALQIGRWAELIQSEHDLDYGSVPQERGNSLIRQSRARILGGCSSHNGMISFRPLPADLDEWTAAGAAGWDADTILPYYDRLQINIVPVAAEHRNPFLKDVLTSVCTVLDVPYKTTWNGAPFVDGAGFLEVGYEPATGARSSASVAYLHGVMDHRPNLTLLLEHRATRLILAPDRARAVELRDSSGCAHTVRADRELILACGAIDTPRLLLLSGIGPADELRSVGIEPMHDLAGVGRNLMDHPEGLIVWEAARPLGPERVMDWDAAIAAWVDPGGDRPDLLFHIPLDTWALHAEALGFATPRLSLSMTPNVAKPRSRGTVRLASSSPDENPLIDYRYFTDEVGHDERILVEGIRMARRIAAQSPMTNWIVRETFPGPGVTSQEEFAALVRATNHTVYHVSGTCRMGHPDDALAVVDPRLRVRGVHGLRVVDASIMPTLTATNPGVTVMMVAERAADLIKQDRAA
jgi:choline dehydrogenase-like flavoprotein